jgi:hypothetical protein
MNVINKKIIRDYIYHLETLEDFKEISSKAEGLFRSELKKVDEQALEALIPNENNKPKNEDEIETVSFNDKKFKKLFRKLAVKCHPDKIGTESDEDRVKFLKLAYERLNLANDTYDWGLLLKVALDLNVEVIELDNEQLNNIIDKIESYKKAIERYEQSMAYQWYLKSGEEQQKYLQNCAAIFKMSLKKKG